MEGTHLQFLVFLVFWFLCIRSTTAGNNTISNAREFTKGCLKREREALLNFKAHLVDWDNQLSSWDTKEKDCCKWRGIFCNQTSGHVYGLDLRPTFHYGPNGILLRYMRLEGEISSSLLQLQRLTYLDFSFFDARGASIPQFIGSLRNLKYLNLSNSLFGAETLDHLGNFTRLVTLDLSYNYFQIKSVRFLSQLSDLKNLNMSVNDLSQASDWFQVINMIPSLKNLHLSQCNLSLVTPPPSSFANSSKFLEAIDFSFNNITSSIFPWLFNFNHGLKSLSLQTNQLQGRILDALGAMVSLERLDLSFNHLEGDIPSSLRNLSSLKTLDLSWNDLTGEVPDLRKLSLIRELHLQMNKLNGTTLNPSIGLLSNLEVLDLSSNSMTAVISDIHFLSLSKLRSLDLSSNSFALKVSSNWVPPFQLQILNLRSCKMGPHFPQWLQTQKGIIHLDISDAGISDVISDWFWELPPILRHLNLSSNSISGEVWKLPLILDNLYHAIDLSKNRFGGAIPQLQPNTTLLNISRNKFSGTISNMCTSSEYIVNYLDLSNNFLSGELPDCWIKWRSLRIINLGNNNFSGTIPASFGEMTMLTSLQLRNNSFSGELPPSLANCTGLQIVDVGENRLSGQIPAWIGENLSLLIVLRLRSNNFHGAIPMRLCYLASLQILDFSHNKISGSIPGCLSNFTAMSKTIASVDIFRTYYMYTGDPISNEGWNIGFYVGIAMIAWKGIELEYGKTLGLVKCIDLSCNNFTGKIPGEITSLVGLISLNLSHNQLSGVIPGRINRMKSLESLDLSANHLSGKLPEGLSDLNFLSYLNLSDNNLSGKIPTGTQLEGFANTSFQGNAGLCGKPLSIICPGEEAAADNPSIDRGSKNDDEQDSKDEIISSGFYLSMGAGFATGFWAICGSLLGNRAWRHAYFQLLEMVGRWVYVRVVHSIAKLPKIL